MSKDGKMSTRKSNRRSMVEQIKTERVDRKRRMSAQCVSNCIVCPACTVTVRGEENFRQHYDQEIKKSKDTLLNVDKKKFNYMKLRSQNQNEDGNQEVVKTIEERTKTLNDIRKRRYERYTEMFVVSMKRRKVPNCNNNQTTHASTNNTSNDEDVRESASTYELITCAVCNEFLETSNCKQHLSKCFAKHDYHFDLYSSSEDEIEDDENENEVVPQSWAFMDNDYYRREGQLTRLVVEDVDEDLDIDGDTDTQFGRQQFTEGDIIPCSSDKPETELESDVVLRQAVSTISYPTPSNTKSNHRVCQTDSDSVELVNKQNSTLLTNCKPNDKLIKIIQNSNNEQNILYETLKRHINKIEDKYEREMLKCPICMGPYNEPAVSISCWHTCCSDCWLRVLGTKKLCPKCNNIVSPSQLRKIFL